MYSTNFNKKSLIRHRRNFNKVCIKSRVNVKLQGHNFLQKKKIRECLPVTTEVFFYIKQ